MIVDFGLLIFRSRDDAAGNEGLLAAGFVGIETVIADGLLAFRREVVGVMMLRFGKGIDRKKMAGMVCV